MCKVNKDNFVWCFSFYFCYKKLYHPKYKGENMNTRKVINLLAYISVILIMLATITSYVTQSIFHLSSEIAYICSRIAYYLAFVVTLVSAFIYASSKRNTIYMAILVVCLIVIIVFTFIL